MTANFATQTGCAAMAMAATISGTRTSDTWQPALVLHVMTRLKLESSVTCSAQLGLVPNARHDGN